MYQLSLMLIAMPNLCERKTEPNASQTLGDERSHCNQVNTRTENLCSDEWAHARDRDINIFAKPLSF